MADIKKLTQVVIQYPESENKDNVLGFIYIPADRVIGLDKELENTVSNLTVSVSQVDGLDQKLEEAKTEWIIV